MAFLFIMFIMLFVFFGLPLALALLLRSDSRAGARIGAALGISEAKRRAIPSFSRWWHADRDREQAARETAQRYRFTYIGRSTEERDRIAHFFLFRHKAPGTVDELVLGESAAMRESLFTYYDRPRWRSTFAHFTSAMLDLPEFRVGARDFPLRDLTSPAIAFDDVAAFSASYEVRGEQEMQIRRLLDPIVRTRLAVHGGFWIEGQGSELLCGKSVDYTQVGERDTFFKTAREICALFSLHSPAA